MSSVSPPDRLPCTYGKYELLERIGSGGMADVYKARLAGWGGFEKIVVIKRMLPHMVRQEQFVSMFVEEAKIAARIQHRNVVQVFELGSVQDELFIAMEYIAGTDLSVLLRNAVKRKLQLPVWFSLHVMSEVLSGLSVVHAVADENGKRLNVVHRDVTPSNVFISYAGDIKLGDFGVATSTLGGDKTRAGELKGKVPYMSPEQIQGKKVDQRADVFSAGVVLWECLTQRRLFGGRPEYETMSLIMKGDRVPPSRYNPSVPAELDEAVLAALVVDREQRISSAEELQRRIGVLLPRLAPQILQADVRSAVEVLLGQSEVGATPSMAPPPTRLQSSKQFSSTTSRSFLEPTPGAARVKPFQVNPERPSLPVPPPKAEVVVDSPSDKRRAHADALPRAEIDPESLVQEEPLPDEDIDLSEDLPPRPGLTVPAPPLIPAPRLEPVILTGGAARSDLPPWQLRLPIRRDSSGQVIAHDGGYRGPRPFWLQNETTAIWGPCDYGTIRSFLAIDLERHKHHYRLAGYQTAWVDLDVFASLTGQEGLGRRPPPAQAMLEGSLRVRSLASVLAEIWSHRPTGRLVITGEDANQPPRRELHFVEGLPIYVGTDAAGLQLPDILLRQGLVGAEDMPVILHEVLYRLEPIEEIAARYVGVDLDYHYSLLMRERAMELFFWRSGTFAFEPGGVTRKARPLARSPLSLALHGLSRARTAVELEELIRPNLRATIQPAPEFEALLPELELGEQQERAARELASAGTIAKVLGAHPSERDLYLLAAYALIELGLLAPVI
ncbi:MAG: protein kinase [Deltaproteobacteria bacterium]|nr:protein kinase [Deltaproteobacteria bacterium]